MEDWKLPVELENVFGLHLLFRIAVDLRDDSLLFLLYRFDNVIFIHIHFCPEIDSRFNEEEKKLNLKKIICLEKPFNLN